MQSPFDSTSLTSNEPSGLTSNVPLCLTSNMPSALTSDVPSGLKSNDPSALMSNVSSAVTSNVPSALTSSTPSLTSTTPPTPAPAVPSAPASVSDADGAVSISAETAAGVPLASWAGFSSQLDPQQLRFQIGPSTSPIKAYQPRSLASVTITAVPSKPGTSTGLFGSEIVSEASRAPGRFKFQTQAPAVAPARKLVGQPRDTRTSPGRTIDNAPKYTPSPGTSGHSHRTPLPNLGPDVVIRPVSSLTAIKKPPGGGPKQNTHPGLQDSEIFQLLAGYRYLKDEVASLKVQLANSQALMQEILNNFSSEVAKINIRLTAVEQGRNSNQHEQGRIAHEQGKIEHEQGRIAHEQGRIEHEQRRNVEDTHENIENHEKCLSSELGNLTITKEE